MEVNCLCAKDFEFEKPLMTSIDGVDIYFIQCPHCAQRYLSYVADKELRDQLEKTKELHEKAQNYKLSFAKRQKAKNRLRQLTVDNRRMMQQKKAQYQHLIHQVIG